MTSVRTALIPAAGWGTRMLPATKVVPKELLPVLSKPVLQYVIDEAIDSGIERIILIVSPGKDAIRRHLEDDPAIESFLRAAGKDELIWLVHDVARGAKIEYVLQSEQRGLGHAVLTAREAVGGEPFALLLGDTIIQPDAGQAAGVAQLLKVFESRQASVVSVRHVPREWVSRYGIVDGRAEPGDPRVYRLDRLVEKPSPEEAPTDLAIAGRYVFTADIFDELSRVGPGKGGEIQLTDAMNALAKRQPMYALLWQAKRYDIGNPADHLKCCIELSQREPGLYGQLVPWLRSWLADQTREM